MKLSTSIVLCTILSLLSALGRGSPSVSLPNCPDRCGNITIPYPFGIGSHCSANSSYSITCHDATKPVLDSLSLEVVEFLLNKNTVRVMLPATPLNCSFSMDPVYYPMQGKSLKGTPFTYSDSENVLVVMGCRNEVYMLHNAPSLAPYAGCGPICGDSDFFCNGINCCMTGIPPGLQHLEIMYRTIIDTSNANDTLCGHAFLAEALLGSGLLGYTRSMSFEYKAMIVWKFDITHLHSHCEILPAPVRTWSSPNFPCTCEDVSFRCLCNDGFAGNPYLPGGGCQRVACQDSAHGNGYCPTGTDCRYELGNYTCVNNGLQRRIVFISIGSAAGALLLFTAVLLSSKLIRKQIEAHRRKKFFKQNGGMLLRQQLSSPRNNRVDKTHLFSGRELAQATDNYASNRILGRGGQGTVYKGMLRDGRIVAVKKSQKVNECDLQVFINEVLILSQINHRNIVSLLGCCLETEVPLLVYEFVPNGTLFQHIHKPDQEFKLSWNMRVKIAVEVAGALSYLHSAASAPIYHRDIKSTNILLDDKYRAKVSDFGTSRSISVEQTHLTTRVLGTFGYLDPEYFYSGKFTEKSDVYSFGVVLIELLTGEKAVSSIGPNEERGLAAHFLNSMEENNLFDIVDPRMLDEGPKNEIVGMAEVAKRCVQPKGRQRPTMKEVAIELEGIHIQRGGSVHSKSLEDYGFPLIPDPVDTSEEYSSEDSYLV